MSTPPLTFSDLRRYNMGAMKTQELFTDADIALLNDELSLMAGRLINYAAAVGLAK